MAATMSILNLFCLLSMLLSWGAHGVNIQFYQNWNFTGLVWKSNSSAVCNNIPRDKIPYVYSIRTDTCLIAYNRPNCKSTWSKKYMPGVIILFRGWHLTWIDSFQVCNEEEGGSQLNLDLTTYYLRDNLVPAVLKSFRKVCSCVNVPQYVQNMYEWSINNHHNALYAYFEPDCSENEWESRFIPAGYDTLYTDMHMYEREPDCTKLGRSFYWPYTTCGIKSFGPDPNSTYFQTGCKFEALSYKYVELQKRFEQSKEIQANLERKIESILKQHKDDINSLTQNITQLHCQN